MDTDVGRIRPDDTMIARYLHRHTDNEADTDVGRVRPDDTMIAIY